VIKYLYCTQCKAELNLGGEYPRCDGCNITYYQNSKPCASILPIKDGKVLLTKRAIEPYKGAFDIIGGYLKNGEHPIDGVRREAREETGLDIIPTEILGIYMDQYGKDGDMTLNIQYIGEIKGGEMKAQDDVASLHWIPIEDLPIDVGFQNTKDTLIDLKRRFTKS
jgi:ADP-ribose pyrophosphatase YjhB (NUDIX family)